MILTRGLTVSSVGVVTLIDRGIRRHGAVIAHVAPTGNGAFALTTARHPFHPLLQPIH